MDSTVGRRSSKKDARRALTRSGISVAILATGLVFAVPQQSAFAASITVNSFFDFVANDGECTLREAVINANTDSTAGSTDCAAGSGADVIDLAPGFYRLSIAGADEDAAATGDLDVTSGALTIAGPNPNLGTAVVEAGPAPGTGIDRIFDVNDSASLTIDTVTLRHGTTVLASPGTDGGAIRSTGTLDIVNSVLSGNVSGGGGGAVAVMFGTATIVASEITENEAYGNGGAAVTIGQLNVVSSTVAYNTSGVNGFAGGGAFAWLDVTAHVDIRSSTIVGNQNFGGIGGAVSPTNVGGLTMRNTIVHANTSPQCAAEGSTSGSNFVDDDTCGTAPDPVSGLEDVLLDNGGPTRSFNILPGSNVIGQGVVCDDQNGEVLPFDQRGSPRERGGFCDVGSVESAASSPPFELTQQKLLATVTGRGGFGESVDIDGDWAAIGERSGEGIGQVQIFARDVPTGTWLPDQTITAPGVSGFGAHVALEDNTLVVGADESITIYDRPSPGSLFSETFTDAVTVTSLDMDGSSTVIVGGPGASASVYERNSGSFFLTGSFAEPGVPDAVESIALEGNVAVLGVPGVNGGLGAAFVYERNAEFWEGRDVLVNPAPPLPSVDHAFGAAVDLDSDRLVVGHPGRGSAPDEDSGAVWVYTGSPGSYSVLQELRASDFDVANLFGSSVDLDGSVLVVGSPLAEEQSVPYRAGAAYVFTSSGGPWTESTIIRPVDDAREDRFGGDVAWSDGRVLVGSSFDDNVNGSDAGSAYVIEGVEPPILSTVVNDTGDGADASPGDGECETAFENGICTLRAAIEETNAVAGADVITFDLPGSGVQTITPTTLLPFVTDALTIDGASQPGAICSANWPPTLLVEVDATNAGTGIAAAAPLFLRGLIINRYSVDGVFIDSSASGSRIECNFIGTNATGTATVGSFSQAGIFLNASSNNSIGGISPAQRNLLSGPDFQHIRMPVSDGNAILGNYIGTDVTGTTAMGPGFTGHAIWVSGNNNRIGGTLVGEGNRITNANKGILLTDISTEGPTFGYGNSIRGNAIFGNFDVGIDLGLFPGDGVSFNHQGLIDGPNHFQNYPVLTIAASDLVTTRVAGTLDSLPNRTYEIDVFANAECDSTSFGEGGQFLGTFSTTTDANGVATFDTTVPGGPGEPFGITTTATDMTTGDTSEFSYCRPASTTNLTWATAQAITSSADQFITDVLQEKWFKVSVQPGDRVKVQLTGQPGSALTLHRDPFPIYNGLINPTNAAVLSAEAADTAFLPAGSLPSGFLPSGFLPSGFLPSDSLPSGFLERGFLPSGFLPSGFLPTGSLPSGFLPTGSLPSGFLPSGFLPSGFLPSGFLPTGALPSDSLPSGFLPSGFLPSGFLPSGFLPAGSLDAYSSAARRSLLGASMDPYATVQTIERATYDLNEDLYIRVVGPYDVTTPFHLEVTVDGVCGEVDDVPAGLVAIAGSPVPTGSRNTLILTDSSRLPGTASEVATALADLQALADRADVNGTVIDLADPRYQRVAFANSQADAHPTCPGAKNMVATEIKRVINAHRAANPGPSGTGTSLQYIVLAGGADVIPFFQVQDVAGLASEREYVAPVAPDSPSDAGLRSALVKGQDFYGSSTDLTIGSRALSIPDLAVGRLVDSATDISAAVANYVATGGVVTPSSSLVTGYDFVGDAAEAIRNEMDAGTASRADTLIQAPGLDPADPSAWSADDLRAKLFAGGHDVVMLTGHFSAGNLLAADYRTTLTAEEVLQSTADLRDSIVLALGCHGGFSIPSPDLLADASPDPDWAKTFLRKGSAGFIAATGYAYGDTELTEYGERLFLTLAQQMRTGSGPIPLGRALVAAKRQYLSETAQLSGIDEKTIVEMTLYGLPMMKVDMPGARRTPPNDASIIGGTVPAPGGPGATFGLTSATTTIDPGVTATPVPLVNLSDDSQIVATKLAGPDGFVANPFEPIYPKRIDNVSVDGRVLRGVAFRGGTYSDTDGITLLTTAPATETSRPHASFNSDVFYPNQTWMPNFYDAVTGGATRLITIGAQYKSRAPGSNDGTLRTFGSIDLALYYLPSNWTAPNSPAEVKAAAVSAAPTIIGASATSPNGTTAEFKVRAAADGSAGVQAVWVLYTGVPGSPFHGTWRPLDLVQDPTDPTAWSGSLPLGGSSPGQLRYIVQAVGGAGLTALSTNLGQFYSVTDTQTPPPAPAATAITFLSAPATGTYRTPSTFRVALTSFGSPLANQVVLLDIGGQQAFATTDGAGQASITLTPIVTPGPYTAQASFRGSPTLLSSSTSAPFELQKDSTTLTVTAGTGGPVAVAHLSDSRGGALGGKSVFFVVSGNGLTAARSVITDPWGDATLEDLDLPTGTYVLDAYFSGAIPVGGGQSVVLDDDAYTPSQRLGTSISIVNGTPPTITASATSGGQPYLADTWTKQDVVVHFECTATNPGATITSCTADQTISTEGTTPSVTGTAVDSGGRSATTSFGPVKIDKTPPVVTITTPPANANYAVGAVVNAAFTCTDALSGIASCTGTAANGTRIDTTTPGTKTFTVVGTDAAGNETTQSVTYTVTGANAAPVVLADMGVPGLQEIGFQSRVVALVGTFTDPDGRGPYTASVRWNPGGPFTSLILNSGTAFVAGFVYPTNGARTVTVRICDAGGACGTDDIVVRAGVTQKVTPVRECVTDRGNRVNPRYRARFGYRNPAAFAIAVVTVPLVENTFTALPALRGQPQIFLPGTRTNVFGVDFHNGSVAWRLNGTTVTANASSPRC